MRSVHSQARKCSQVSKLRKSRPKPTARGKVSWGMRSKFRKINHKPPSSAMKGKMYTPTPSRRRKKESRPPVAALLFDESRLKNSTSPIKTDTMPAISRLRLRVTHSGRRTPELVGGGCVLTLFELGFGLLAELVLVEELLVFFAGLFFVLELFALVVLAGAAALPDGDLPDGDFLLDLLEDLVEDDFSAMVAGRIIAHTG